MWMLRFATNARRASPPPPPITAADPFAAPNAARNDDAVTDSSLPLRPPTRSFVLLAPPRPEIVLAKLTGFLAIASYAVGSRLKRLAPTELAWLAALPPPGAEGDFEPIAREDEWIERITACFVARWFFVWSLNAPPKARRRLGNTKVKALERAGTARAPRRWAKFRLAIVHTRVKVRRTRERTRLVVTRRRSSLRDGERAAPRRWRLGAMRRNKTNPRRGMPSCSCVSGRRAQARASARSRGGCRTAEVAARRQAPQERCDHQVAEEARRRRRDRLCDGDRERLP
jgi:hypothetical protein